MASPTILDVRVPDAQFIMTRVPHRFSPDPVEIEQNIFMAQSSPQESDQESVYTAAQVVPATLLDILSNSLLLRQTAPYIPISSLFALAATSKTYKSILVPSTDAFRYLDLSPIKSATPTGGPIDPGGVRWRSQRMDEALTEDEFYSGPIRGVMSRLARRHILSSISTMILDGLSVPAEVVREIIAEDRYNVRILSIREAKHLNERKLMQVLRYACRPSRPAGTPKLKALYVFGPMEPSSKPQEPAGGRRRSPTRYPDSPISSVMDALGAQLGAEWNRRSQEALSSQLSNTQDKWWQATGSMFKKNPLSDWAGTLQECEGIIHFDAVLCRGPRHDVASRHATAEQYLPPALATVALGPSGCAKCGTSPEGPACFGDAPANYLPLLAPPPLHSSGLAAAQKPISSANSTTEPRLIVRCGACLRGRWCERCHKWWCEECYEPPASQTVAPAQAQQQQQLTQLQQQELFQAVGQAAGLDGGDEAANGAEKKEIKPMGTKRECFGCGFNCIDCKKLYIRECRICKSDYCVVDNDGSSAETCDWCNYSGRRTRELY